MQWIVTPGLWVNVKVERALMFGVSLADYDATETRDGYAHTVLHLRGGPFKLEVCWRVHDEAHP